MLQLAACSVDAVPAVARCAQVKDAIEKEYWLLMLSQPRPAPKPASEPPLSRLSHYIYNGNGNQGGGDGQQNGSGLDDQLAGGLVAGGAAELGASGEKTVQLPQMGVVEAAM